MVFPQISLSNVFILFYWQFFFIRTLLHYFGQKTYKISVDSEYSPHTLFLQIEKNSFLFFLHQNSLPELYM